MAGTYPTTPAFQSIDMRINTPTLSSETLSGKRRRVGMGHSFYTFQGKYTNMRKQDFAPIIAFIASQYGGLEEFQIVLPEISYSKTTNQTITTITVTANASKGANSVSIGNLGQNEQLLKAGDFFKFSNHSKVYQCVTDCENGDTTLYFSGSLVEDVPSGTTIVYDAVPFTVIIDGEVQEFQTGVGGISTMSVDFREVW